MGLIEDVFGGGDIGIGGKGTDIVFGKDPEVSQVGTTTPEQEELLKKLIAELSGQQVTPTTFTQPTGEEAQRQTIQKPEDISETGQSSRDVALEQILQSILQADPAQRQKQFQAGVQQPLEERLTETLEDIGRTSRSPFTSDIQRQKGQATEDFIDALAKENANFQLQSQAQDIQARQQAAQLLTGLGAQEVGLATAQLSAETQTNLSELSSNTQTAIANLNSATQQQIATMDAELKAQGLDQAQRDSILNGLLNLLGIGTKETVVDPGSEGLLGDLLGIGTAALLR